MHEQKMHSGRRDIITKRFQRQPGIAIGESDLLARKVALGVPSPRPDVGIVSGGHIACNAADVIKGIISRIAASRALGVKWARRTCSPGGKSAFTRVNSAS